MYIVTDSSALQCPWFRTDTLGNTPSVRRGLHAAHATELPTKAKLVARAMQMIIKITPVVEVEVGEIQLRRDSAKRAIHALNS